MKTARELGGSTGFLQGFFPGSRNNGQISNLLHMMIGFFVNSYKLHYRK